MSNVEGRVSAVVCLAIGMCFAASNQLAAQEQAIPPAIRSAMSSDVDVHLALTQPTSARRPSILVPLYVSFGVMQALDVHSTQLALAGGGREGNPIMRGIVGSPVAMAALKVGATAGVILLSESVRKRHPLAAVVTMVSLNSAYAMIVSRNYSIARR